MFFIRPSGGNSAVVRRRIREFPYERETVEKYSVKLRVSKHCTGCVGFCRKKKLRNIESWTYLTKQKGPASSSRRQPFGSLSFLC